MRKLLDELIKEKILEIGRGKVISKKDIKNNPGEFPVYSSSVLNEGFFGSYNEYMFDQELVTWSVDGGGMPFYREKHKFSVTNVSGWIKVLEKSVLDTKYLYYSMYYYWDNILDFNYINKAHPSIIRHLYDIKIIEKEKQDKIVENLSKIQENISFKHEQILFLDELVKSQFIYRGI